MLTIIGIIVVFSELKDEVENEADKQKAFLLAPLYCLSYYRKPHEPPHLK